MSRVVFLGLSAYGHINPTLSIVKELLLRGEEVIYVASNRFKDLITSVGCKHIEIKYSMVMFGSHHLNSKEKRTEEEFIESVKQFYDSLEYQLKLANKLKRQIQNLKPDYIIHDSTAYYIKYILSDLDIPCISSIAMFALNEKMFATSKTLLSDFYNVNLKNTPEQVVEHIKEIEIDNYLQCGYKHNYLDNSMTKENFNIVYTSRLFQPYSDFIDASYHFAGNNLELRKSLERKYSIQNITKSRKIILISFGSVISGSQELINFYSKMMKYFSKYNATFIMNIGKIHKTMFEFVPNNFILENEISQLQLLERADLFITHGGLNSTSEALQLNTPMIVFPQAMDQFIVAEQVEKTGIGRIFKSEDMNFNELEYLITDILSNQEYTQNAEYIAGTYRDTGEENVAVDKMLEYVAKN